MKVGRFYCIDWLDHHDGEETGHAWHPLADVKAEACAMRTGGYLVKEGDDAIAVAHTMDDEHSSIPFTIVKAAIVRIVEINLPPLGQGKKKKGAPHAASPSR